MHKDPIGDHRIMLRNITILTMGPCGTTEDRDWKNKLVNTGHVEHKLSQIAGTTYDVKSVRGVVYNLR